MSALVNNYVFKALDAYPYDLDEAMEALHYALAYDDKNIMALALMGRIYAEVLKDYEKAKAYFSEALTENIHAFNVYPDYINVLLWNEDYREAEKLIDFGLTIKGSDKAVLYVKKALMHEKLKEYTTALAVLKEAKIHTFNSDFMYDITQHKERIKGKMPKKKKKEKSDKTDKKAKKDKK